VTHYHHNAGPEDVQYLDAANSGSAPWQPSPLSSAGPGPEGQPGWSDSQRMIAVTPEQLSTAIGSAENSAYVPTVPTVVAGSD
jgi:hypothetical protein